MYDHGEKKFASVAEPVIDIICLAASFGILFLLPQGTGFLFYLLFAASALLFCIGFFRLGFLFDVPAGSKAALFTGVLFAVLGAVVNIAGIYGICRDNGSMRSIAAASLLLIEAFLLFSIAGSGAGTSGAQRLLAILPRIVAVFVLLFGIGFVVWKQFSESSVMAGTMLLIECLCLWRMGGSGNPFNKLTPEIQAVPGMKTPVGQLGQVFAGVETQLGYPWIGKIKTLKQDALIYGPSEDGFVVYGYYHYGRFYVSGSTNPLFPHPEDARRHTVQEVPDESGILLAKERLPEAYVNMFARYAENGTVQWSRNLPGPAELGR